MGQLGEQDLGSLEGRGTLRCLLETDVKQELLYSIYPVEQASWRHKLPQRVPASKLLPHASPQSACDLLFARMWRVITKHSKTKGTRVWLTWKERF